MIHAQISADLEAEPRRKEPRLQADMDIALREFGAEATNAVLLNISSHGFMAETDALIAAGSRIWLTLPAAGRVNALVIWTKGARLGGEFASPIDPLAVFQALGESSTAR